MGKVKEVYRSESKEKKCSKCGKWKSFDFFPKNKGKRFGINSSCLECGASWFRLYRTGCSEKERERLRAYYENNKEKVYKRTREWHLENPEKVKKSDRLFKMNHPEKTREQNRIRRSRKKNSCGTITSEEERTLFEKYGHRCINPDCPDSRKPVTLDHVVPLSRGGKNIIKNAQPLCRSCNSRKGTKTIDYRIFYQ